MSGSWRGGQLVLASANVMLRTAFYGTIYIRNSVKTSTWYAIEPSHDGGSRPLESSRVIYDEVTGE